MNRRLEKPTAIFFDWDETLVSTISALCYAYTTVRAHFDLPPATKEETYRLIRLPKEIAFEIAFKEHFETAIDLFYETLSAIPTAERFSPFPGAHLLIQELQELPLTLGIVSNKKSCYLHEEVNATGWADAFAVLKGSGDAPRDKPHPDLLEAAYTDLNLEPSSSIWFVGDSSMDWQCAQTAGCQPIAVNAAPDRDIPFFPTVEDFRLFLSSQFYTESMKKAQG